jgi:hypothetical protein
MKTIVLLKTIFLLSGSASSKLFFSEIQEETSFIDPVLLQEET